MMVRKTGRLDDGVGVRRPQQVIDQPRIGLPENACGRGDDACAVFF
jgi:hypothetical protein